MANGEGPVNGTARKRNDPASKVENLANQEDTFLVSYRDRIYDIREFLSYHPGGTKMFGCFRNKSLDAAFRENPHSKGAFHLLEDYTMNGEQKFQECEDLVDWNKPILHQVGSLGERYWEWSNLPVNRKIRLFQSNVLENMSITPWYLIPIVWIPICMYFLYSGFTNTATKHSGSLVFETFVSFAFGVLMWTILEYVLHRKLFHFKPPKNSRILTTLHFVLHGIHHKAPFDDRRLVFPPIPGLLIMNIIWYVYEAVLPKTMIHFIGAGTITGYICYDMMHYYLHHGAPKAGTYLHTMKRNHNYHHFLHHDLGFGICVKIWDRAFGTEISLRELKKPIEW